MIRTLLLTFVAICLAWATTNGASAGPAHQFEFRAIDGGALPLSAYRGKAVMVVNTASFCGYTGQYADLQAVWSAYRDRGLVVVGVPSNDFGHQEPGTSAQIKEFCEVNFAIDFPMADKEIVKGDSAHPFYVWARETLGERAAPKWNFHKYLLDQDGNLVAWFPTSIRPNAPRVTDILDGLLAPKS
ncbi:MAG: glutathione peroxidase [Alphaproteobacteria bacterium]|nr:glutathione peroxidase [Alphaproteobacteria bacterium]